jgi:hypothetical protein
MKLSSSLDLSVLEFLQWGDMTLIANEINEERRKAGIKTKVDQSYVIKVCSGKHSNNQILIKAINKALERKGQFPKQVLKVA